MDLGLGNLAELKAALLSEGFAAVTVTDWDTKVTQIGRGVAAQFEQYCNRDFARLAGAIDQFTADRLSWTVRRFPLETVTTVEQQDDVGSGWLEVTTNDVVYNKDTSAGLLYFATTQGTHLSVLRVTYTGGFWYDTTEDASGTLPAGATQLPYDLKLAWINQCMRVWELSDKLGKNVTGIPNAKSIGELELVDSVEMTLKQYIRYQVI